MVRVWGYHLRRDEKKRVAGSHPALHLARALQDQIRSSLFTNLRYLKSLAANQRVSTVSTGPDRRAFLGSIAQARSQQSCAQGPSTVRFSVESLLKFEDCQFTGERLVQKAQDSTGGRKRPNYDNRVRSFLAKVVEREKQPS